MGGRGSNFGVEIVQALNNGFEKGIVQELNVAGMTPVDMGSRFTSAKKTLEYLEDKKRYDSKEQLQVLDKYGYVTRAFQGDEHSVNMDAETTRYVKGKIVTHNHPSVYGGTFSDADINSLRLGMKELRASAREGVYSIKAEKNSNPAGLMNAYNRNADKLQKQMQVIANENAKKKFPSHTEYVRVNRKEQLAVIDKWYRDNATLYGYTYTFEANREKKE